MSISNLRKTPSRIAFLILMAVVVAGLSACGVKSKPGTPDDSTYPLLYPDPKAEAVPATRVTVPGGAYGGGYERKTRTGASGYYEPPPAVTDRPIK
ncbi:MAG: hypothetical protein WD075_08960 [Rhodospirillales bacterium]